MQLADDTGTYYLSEYLPDVTIGGITEAAKTALGPVSVTLNAPAWNADHRCFETPLVQGDDYSGGRALIVPVANWPGRDLLTASAILLTGAQIISAGTADTISFVGAASLVGEQVQIAFEPTAVDTNRSPGVYAFDVQATWGNGEVETVVLPGARLTILQDVSP